MLHNELTRNNKVQLSKWPRSLKLIDNELWSCQWDGISVYDKALKLLRTMRGNGAVPCVHSVALLADGTVAVAGAWRLYQSSKQGRLIHTFYAIDCFVNKI